MQWRNPKDELPGDNEIVWALLSPHKDRGTFYNSVQSIEIVCGETCYSEDRRTIRIENGDELGMGWISWYLKVPEDDDYNTEVVLAWMPLADMPEPEWLE